MILKLLSAPCSFLCLASLVTFIWIVLMRWLAGPIVWLTLLAFTALFAFGEDPWICINCGWYPIMLCSYPPATYYCFMKWMNMKDDPDHDGELIFTTNLDYYTNLSDTWLAFGELTSDHKICHIFPPFWSLALDTHTRNMFPCVPSRYHRSHIPRLDPLDRPLPEAAHLHCYRSNQGVQQVT